MNCKEKSGGCINPCECCKYVFDKNNCKEGNFEEDKPKIQREILQLRYNEYHSKYENLKLVKTFADLERQEAIKNCKYIIENCGLEYSKDALYIFKVFFNISEEELK